jgi:hypothetical protein
MTTRAEVREWMMLAQTVKRRQRGHVFRDVELALGVTARTAVPAMGEMLERMADALDECLDHLHLSMEVGNERAETVLAEYRGEVPA